MLSAALSTVVLSTQDGLLFCNLKFEDSMVRLSYNLHSFRDLACHDVITFSLSPTGKHVALTDNSKKLVVHRVEDGACVKATEKEIPRCASCMAFTPDERVIVVGEKSGNVYQLSVSDVTSGDKLENLTPMLGHLSILSDIAISYDGMLLGTCDRDEKIRISRFQQPFVIEAFCLGHTSFISQLAFVPRSYLLVSAGGDGYLRLWQSDTGTELSSIQLNFDREPNVGVEENEQSTADKPVIVSRLLITESNICVGSSSSHPIAFAVQIQMGQHKAAHWGPVSKLFIPGNRPLVDSALCTLSSVEESPLSVFVGLCLEPAPHLKLWSLAVSTQSTDLIEWQKLEVVDPIPASLLKLPDLNPRSELLKGLEKAEVDRSRLEAYEETKLRRHQNVSERRLRHQQKRQSKKRLKQVNPPGVCEILTPSDIL